MKLNLEVLRVDSFITQSGPRTMAPTVIESPITSTIPSSETWSACFTVSSDEC